MNKRKLVKVIFTIAFLGATGIFYSCNRGSEETKLIFDTKEKEAVQTALPSETQNTKDNGIKLDNEIQDKEAEENASQANVPVETTASATYYVYLCGEVVKPDVYQVTEGARVVDVVNLAGGFTENAAREIVNLARPLVDGEQIYVPTKEEAASEGYSIQSENSGDTLDTSTEGRKININTATIEELTTLPGIGQAKAQSIINYRDTNGKFSSIEELMQIEGIKSGVFNKIQEYITVK